MTETHSRKKKTADLPVEGLTLYRQSKWSTNAFNIITH